MDRRDQGSEGSLASPPQSGPGEGTAPAGGPPGSDGTPPPLTDDVLSRRVLRRLLPEHVQDGLVGRLSLVVAWVLLVIAFSIARPATFPTGSDFSTIFGTQAVLVVVTLGLIIPLTTGDLDLSVAGSLALSAMLIAVLNAEDHVPLALAIAAGLGAGALVGALNAVCVLVFGIDPFIVTLGTGQILSGIVIGISGSQTISGVSPSLVNGVVVDRLAGIPLEFYYALGLTIVMWFVFEFTTVGKRLLFVGQGRSVSRLSGLRVFRIRFFAFVFAGIVAAGAGVLYVGTSGAADPTSGASFLLPAYAAAFLGATAISPGRFNAWGTIIAAYFLQTGISGLGLLGVGTYVQSIFYGGALIVAVGVSQLARGRAPQELTKI